MVSFLRALPLQNPKGCNIKCLMSLNLVKYFLGVLVAESFSDIRLFRVNLRGCFHHSDLLF